MRWVVSGTITLQIHKQQFLRQVVCGSFINDDGQKRETKNAGLIFLHVTFTQGCKKVASFGETATKTILTIAAIVEAIDICGVFSSAI